MRALILLTLVLLCLAAAACRSSRGVRNARAVRNIGRAGAYTQRDNARPTPTPSAYSNRGISKAEHDDLSEEIRLDPDLASAYYNRARLLNQMGQCEAANADLEKANVAERFDCAPEAEQDGQD